MAWITPEAAAALRGTTVRVAYLVTFEFRSMPLRVWSGVHITVIDGHEYLPAGDLGSISGLDTPRDATSEPVNFELSGVNQSVLAAAVADRGEVAGRPVSVVARLLDDAWQPVGSSIPLWRGVMQRPRIVRSEGEEPVRVVGIEAEGVWEGRSRQAAGRFNDADQNYRYPGDRFFRFASAQAARPAVWPDF